MLDARWIAIVGSLAIALFALIIMYRERNWAQKKYKQQLKLTILQPEFIADLRSQLESDVQAHLKDAMLPLNKEIAEVIAGIKKQTETSISEGLKSNAAILAQSAQRQSAQVQSVVSVDTKKLHTQIEALISDVNLARQETSVVLEEYRNQVLTRVKSIINEQVADLLAEYLQSSLKGLELGDQQEFILERLEANKESLLEELGNDQNQ